MENKKTKPNNTIILSQEEYERFIKNNPNPYSINKNLIIELLSSSISYDLILDLINDQISKLYLYYKNNGKQYLFESFNKSSFLQTLFNHLESELDILPREIQDKYEIITKSTQIEEFIKKQGNKTYSIDIEGKTYKFLIADFFTFLSLNENTIEKYIKNMKIFNVPLTHFIYALKQFFFEKKLLTDYTFPPEMIVTYNYIMYHPAIDIEAINKLPFSKDYILNDITVSKDIETEVLKDIPEEFNSLEKSIYIYIMLCKLFTYDDEFYAVKQKGPIAEKHKDYHYLNEISLDNNEIVCYEFVELFAYFLDKLGLHYEIRPHELTKEQYGKGHVYLIFCADKFIVKADYVTTILNGDIYRGKANQLLRGFVCNNQNQNTKEEFLSFIVKVINHFKNKEAKDYNSPFFELVKKYENMIPRKNILSFDQKLTIFFENIKNVSLPNVDAISYLLDLRRVLFSNEEKENKISLSIVRNNIPFNQNKKAESITVISISQEGFTNKDPIYYLYKPYLGIQPIDKSTLVSYLETKRFEYISEVNPTIPNIDVQITK